MHQTRHSCSMPFANLTSVSLGRPPCFPSRASRAPLVIRSLISENGVIFSDGIESDYLEFNSGISATIADR
jgi:hypothetical protein